jgi:hypothetical protein
MENRSNNNISKGQKNAVNFLMFSYFGFTPLGIKEKSPRDIAFKCAQRAYLDLNRTLRFNKDVNINTEEHHKAFRDSICSLIADRTLQLISSTNENFDGRHKKICEEIKAQAENYKECGEYILGVNKNKEVKKKDKREEQRFYYGQAQKWLNMTLKYMWFTGLWNEKIENLLPVLHVPIDNHVIESVWHEGHAENAKGWLNIPLPDKFAISLPCTKKERRRKFNQDIVAWSKWSYTEYIDFQNSLRTAEFLLQNMTPIEWENHIWINSKKAEDANQKTA